LFERLLCIRCRWPPLWDNDRYGTFVPRASGFGRRHSMPSRSGSRQVASGAGWAVPAASKAITVPCQCPASVSLARS